MPVEASCYQADAIAPTIAGRGCDWDAARAGQYRRAISGDQQVTVSGICKSTYTVGDGLLLLAARGNSAGIWTLNGPGKIGENGCICGN